MPTEIWRCHLAAYVKELYWSACRTCSRINFPHSTNQIIVIWPRRFLPSALELREPSPGDVPFISPVTDHNTKYPVPYYFRVKCVLRDEAYDLSSLSENRKPTHFQWGQHKVSTFSIINYRPWALVRSGFESTTTRTVVWNSTNWLSCLCQPDDWRPGPSCSKDGRWIKINLNYQNL